MPESMVADPQTSQVAVLALTTFLFLLDNPNALFSLYRCSWKDTAELLFSACAQAHYGFIHTSSENR